MKTLLNLIAAFVFVAGSGFVCAKEGDKKPATPAQQAQQQKMKSCNADAKKQGLKGDERKQFMSGCLSAKPAPAAASGQQDKMKQCNADAGKKALKGDERKQFMSSCLKG